MVKGKTIILVGRSGAGKDSVAYLVAKRNPGLPRAISTTSRPMRAGEVDGEDYHFISKEDFRERMELGFFWEYISYEAYKQGELETWYYGLEKNRVDLNRGRYIIPADLPRMRMLKKQFGNKVVAVYIDVPEDDRQARAIARDDNFDSEEWERRVSDENYVFKDIKKEVDYIVSNQTLEECVRQVENIYKWHA